MLAKLGDIVFEPKNLPFNEIARDSRYSWQITDLVNGKKHFHYSGGISDEITINGVLYNRAGGTLAGFIDLFVREPSDAMDRLRKLAESAEPQYFSVTSKNNATPLGRWVILRIHEKQTLFLKNGFAQKVEFSLQLIKYEDS